MINAQELIDYYSDKNNQKNEVGKYFLNLDKKNTGYIDADSFIVCMIDMNKRIQIDLPGKKEWEWTLNLIKKKSGDNLSRDEAEILYGKICEIAVDYLYSKL